MMTHREMLKGKIDNICILFVYIITTPAQLTDNVVGLCCGMGRMFSIIVSALHHRVFVLHFSVIYFFWYDHYF